MKLGPDLNAKKPSASYQNSSFARELFCNTANVFSVDGLDLDGIIVVFVAGLALHNQYVVSIEVIT